MGFGLYFSFGAVTVAVGVVLLWRGFILQPVAFHPVDLTNKVVLVTGGSAGIGVESIRAMYQWNATIIMPVRDLKKGQRVADDILNSWASHPHAVQSKIDLMELDLTSFDSVRKFASQVNEKYDRIDILMLNAGMMGNTDIRRTVDGIETVYQVNHLSHALLTRLLLPTVSRIVFVSSMMHYWGGLNHSSYSASSLNADPSTAIVDMQSYCDTKLMNVAFSNALNKRLAKYNKEHPEHIRTSVSIHPGYVISDIDRGSPQAALLSGLRKLIARPTADGAVTQVAAATSPEIVAMGGGLYFEDQCIMNGCTQCLFCKVNVDPVTNKPTGGVQALPAAMSAEEQDWLWETTSKIIGLPTEL